MCRRFDFARLINSPKTAKQEAESLMAYAEACQIPSTRKYDLLRSFRTWKLETAGSANPSQLAAAIVCAEEPSEKSKQDFSRAECNTKGGHMDAFGDHTFACESMGCRTDRRDALKHAFALISEAAGLNPSVEKNLGFESGKRADVYLPLGIYETSKRRGGTYWGEGNIVRLWLCFAF